MKVDQAYPNKYMKAGDVKETPAPYTITDVSIEEIGRNRDEKVVISFKGEGKSFVCNKTNCNTIAKALGTDEMDDWIGKTIRLYSTEVQFGDEMVEAIRVSLKPGFPAKEDDVPGRQKRDWDEEPETVGEIPF